MPIDTWVGSFQEHTLGLKRKEFFHNFKNLGKLERLIWFVSQANKTNIKLFFFTLWCTRYGVSGGRIVREANPLSCYECCLRSSCVGFKKIERLKVYIVKESENPKGLFDADFLVQVNRELIPKVVFKKKGKDWRKIDEFSGLILHTQKTNDAGKIVSVSNFVENLPKLDMKISKI